MLRQLEQPLSRQRYNPPVCFYSAFPSAPSILIRHALTCSNEVEFTGQIYEPPLQYHFLKRPYTLIP